MLYDAVSGTLMVIDFERAELRDRQPLGMVNPNGQGRKRKRGLILWKQGKDDFTKELQSVVEAQNWSLRGQEKISSVLALRVPVPACYVNRPGEARIPPPSQDY
ncbi:hypothetical protein CHGG_06095 [Chaetomium globosum CBS 148.51]|uniref:Uncharacterized protein n=1 Tax=Chaetomium globosum (strain ATCC 6205 / CBS 148.51 / DSM 1962 / NBRC 6347 / NRRL 1970) TaxID=306901 RepID=Q2H5H0_CHAGB|nr:uncharacterized protein CHGG_06095 [Chaetomium globosum CBS 148.51]EAQ89476.1 hypothetical protein CHGG_06095 [Chaetomium globosum CBS 148.51]